VLVTAVEWLLCTYCLGATYATVGVAACLFAPTLVGGSILYYCGFRP
jgi:hypothetical protein